MSAKERERLKVLHAVQKRHITQVQAGKELGISVRWVRVLLKRVQARGDAAVVHRLRGRPSNRRLPEKTKRRVVELFRQQKQARQWHDYGPTLAAEETGGGAWHPGEPRDPTSVADDSEAVASAPGAGGAGAYLASTAGTLGRTAAVGQQRARLAGRTRGDAVPDRHDRRRHFAGGGALCAARLDGREPAIAGLLCEGARAAAGGVHRQGESVSDRGQRDPSPRRIGGAAHADRTGVARVGDRVDRRPIATGQGTDRALLRHRPGPAGERLAQSRSPHPRASQWVSRRQLSAAVGAPVQPATAAGRRCPPATGGGFGSGFGIESRVEQRMVAQDYTVRWQGETYQIPRPQIGGGMRGSRVAVEKRLDGNVWMRWKQRRVRLDLCPLAVAATYRVDPVAPPAAVAKPNAAERARRRLEARRKADEAFHRLPDRPLWQVLRDEPG